jgi:hypothetical protein
MSEAGMRWAEFADIDDQVGDFAENGADGCQNGGPNSNPH